MAAVQWLRNTLDLAGVPYKETHHHVAITAQDMAQKEHVSGHQVAKTVAVDLDGVKVLLALHASRMVCLEKLRETARTPNVRLLNEAEILFEFNDCEVGAIPPMRHWPQVGVWMDQELARQQEISFQAGTHESSIRMKLADWRAIVDPRVVSFSIPLEQGGFTAGEENRWRETQVAIMEMESAQGD